jgi:hypothetical protein
MEIVISPSCRPGCKWMATAGNRTVHFGASGYEDYTLHKDPDRRRLYIQRHKRREDWTQSGLLTAGWLSRWLLWERPTLRAAIAAANKMYEGVTFRLDP